MRVSLVVPCFNEVESVARLVAEIDAVISEHALDAEVILVDVGAPTLPLAKVRAYDI